MGRSAVYSACLHLAVLLIAIFGVPDLLKPSPPIIDRTVVVEIVNPDWLKTVHMASTTNLPQRAEQPPDMKKPEQKQEFPVPYLSALVRHSGQLGPPKAELKPGPESPPILPLLPESSKLPKLESKLKSEPKPEPKMLAPPKPVLPKSDLLPERKDRQDLRPDSFDVLLKDVEKLARTEKIKKGDRKTRSVHSDASMTNQDFEKTIAGLVSVGSTQYSPNLPLSLSEIDAIRAQIERCWNVPTGARDAENLIIEIKVQFASDGQVLHAQLTEDARYRTDRFYRAAADSAKRAVYQCSPIRAPPMKYDLWQEVKLRFNPREMLGP